VLVGDPGPAEATFVPHTRKKSGSTNLPEGTVHVFRDGSTKPTQEELEAKVSTMSLLGSLEDDSDGIMLGVLAVPSWMTPSDFLTFVAPAVEGIGHLRIIRCVLHASQSFVGSKFSSEILHRTAQWSSLNSLIQPLQLNLRRNIMANRSTRWRLASVNLLLEGNSRDLLSLKSAMSCMSCLL